MRILLLNTSDHTGGAAIAALRLLRALRKAGAEAGMLCRDRSTGTAEQGVETLGRHALRKIPFLLERGGIFAANGLSRRNLFAVDTARYGTDVTRTEAFRLADVVHLHWVNQGFISLGGLRRILRSGKPVVWTMHDMWPFTGVCHHADTCEGWLARCGNCPRLRFPADHDLSAATFARKERVYASGRMAFVGCSKWIAALARKAPLCQGHEVTDIPNPIDSGFYAPAPDPVALRREMGLPTDRKLLLFTAFKVTDPNKGVDFLRQALARLCAERPALGQQVGLLLAGQGAETLRDAFPVPVHPLGYLTDETQMRRAYQAADLMLMPTLMDNLPNTLIEAMACGTPCVGFRVGGVPEIIDHGANGYLARYRDSDDLARGIATTLFSPSYPALSRNARAKAVSAYSEQAVAARYLKLYRRLLNETKGPLPRTADKGPF